MVSGGADSDNLRGSENDDTIHGMGGGDLIFGYHRHDMLYGDDGNDIIQVEGQHFQSVDGGAGYDVLMLAVSAEAIDLHQLAGGITNIEEIDISGSGASSIAFPIQNVLNVTDARNALIITGGRDDAVTFKASDWTATGTTETPPLVIPGVSTPARSTCSAATVEKSSSELNVWVSANVLIRRASRAGSSLARDPAG